tara:strand:- start:82118 stop:83767 length:1650 start_codon:yes stop_codon:yes gene_type:complete
MVFPASSDPVFGKNGMIVSTSRHASEAGIKILKKGGNAIDAAVTVGFVLAVTSSSNGNIGGGGFMVAAMANNTVFSLDYREKAPVAAHQDMFLDKNKDVVEGMSLYSLAASGVPGSVDGLLKVLKDYGSGNISRRQILEPAIYLAERGFTLSNYEAKRLNNNKELFKQDDAAKKIFIREDGELWKKGDRLIQTDLAKTLKQISKNGRNGFYKGNVADLIVAEMKRGNGIISHDDLKNYSSIYRTPITGSFHEYEILSMGPPSSGGALLVNILNMLENYNIDTLGWNSSDYIHLLTEVERRAYADRAEHFGDPDYWSVPLDEITSKNYAASRIRDISMERATPSAIIFASEILNTESRETTHYSIVDKDGNAVSVTTTINLSYGGGHLVDGAGFFLNNEMDDFSSKPGVPNAFQLLGNKANAIEPGKRPLSSMTPTIVLKSKKPYLIIGSPGGSTIITTAMQVILNVVIFGMDIKEAVSSPRFHSQWLPDVIMMEPRGLSKDVINNLKLRGHALIPYRWGYIGEANGILINENGFFGGGDVRGETSAIGY